MSEFDCDEARLFLFGSLFKLMKSWQIVCRELLKTRITNCKDKQLTPEIEKCHEQVSRDLLQDELSRNRSMLH